MSAGKRTQKRGQPRRKQAPTELAWGTATSFEEMRAELAAINKMRAQLGALEGRHASVERYHAERIAFAIRVVNIPGTSVLSYAAAFAVVAAGALALRGRPREVARPLLAFGVLALLVAVYFRAREHGDLIHFKDLSFFAPFALAAATVLLVEVAAARRGGARVASAVALAGLAIVLVAGAREQIDQTHEMLTRDMLELREFSDRLPEGSSIRIDLPPDGYQLWARHMLHEHPLSASRPLDETIFPHPPRGRRADYLLARATRPPSRDALPPPLMGNALYAIYRMRPSVPGRDRSSLKLVDRGNIGGLD